MEKRRAKVLFFNDTFGFIKDIDTKEEFYVNYKNIKEVDNGQYKYLKRGELVEYIKRDNGNKAIDVLKVNNKNDKNKDIIFVKIFIVNGDISTSHIYTKIKKEFGFRYVHSIYDILICTDSILSNVDLMRIYDNFKIKKTKLPLHFRNKVIYFN